MANIIIHQGIEDYVVGVMGNDIEPLKTMTDEEIAEYFTPESFTAMFGDESIEYPYEDMEEAARDMRDRMNADEDEQPRRRPNIATWGGYC